MRFLLDTHAFIWWVDANPALSQRARDVITDGANECLFSIASAWEMAIKLSLGRITGWGKIDRDLPVQLATNGIKLVTVHDPASLGRREGAYWPFSAASQAAVR